MMQTPSMYPMPFYNNTDALQRYSTFPGWRAIDMAASPPMAIDPMLQTATHTSPQFQTSPLYSSRLPIAIPQIRSQLPPHMVPLPRQEAPSSDIRTPILNTPAPLYPPTSPYISTLLQLEQGSIAPVDLMTTSQITIPQEPASVDPTVFNGQSSPISSSPEHDPIPTQQTPEFVPPEFPTLDEATLDMSPRSPTPLADDDILQLSHTEHATETGHDEVDVFNSEGFLLDLEPLVWATQAEEVGIAEAHQEYVERQCFPRGRSQKINVLLIQM